MKKNIVVSLFIIWIIGIVLTYGLGYRMGIGWDRDQRSGREAKIHDQVECLKAIYNSANPQNRSEMALNEYLELAKLEKDPEAVRAYLLDLMNKQLNQMYRLNPQAITGEGPGARLAWRPQRVINLLELWVPGQTDYRKIRNPYGDKAPLWDLYLLDAKEAQSRGVNDLGCGGH